MDIILSILAFIEGILVCILWKEYRSERREKKMEIECKSCRQEWLEECLIEPWNEFMRDK